MKHFPGIADEEFIRGPIPMTKQEIRVQVLSKAKIDSDSVVIDIGAGTGSLSIEAALLAPQGKVYSLEREAAGVELIRQNAEKFSCWNLEVIHAAAPNGLEDLPPADVIFIGGSGGKFTEIMQEADRLLKPGGRLIITAITVETVSRALAEAERRPYTINCFQMQVSRLKKVGPYHMFEALNPIFILTCTLPESEGKS